MKPIDRLEDDEFAHLVQRAVAMPDAPPAWVRAAVDLARPVPAATAAITLAEWVGQVAANLIQAVLRSDSWSHSALAAGLRGPASDTRHLLFDAMGRDIDLRISPSAGQFALSGQILGPDEAGTVLLVAQSADPGSTRIAQMDELGEFRLDGLQGGTYLLTLRVGGDEIVLPPIEVGARP